MRVPHVTIDMLVAVIALAQRKNLEPAGKELGLSASAVHKGIEAANQFFQTRLFIVTSEGFELSEVGRVLYAYAIQVLLAEEVMIDGTTHESLPDPPMPDSGERDYQNLALLDDFSRVSFGRIRCVARR